MTSMEDEKKAALEWFNSVLCNDEPENLSAEENRIVAYIRSLLTPPPVDGELAEAVAYVKTWLGNPYVKGAHHKDFIAAVETLIQAATSQQSRKRALHPSMLSAEDLAAIAKAEVPEEATSQQAREWAYAEFKAVVDAAMQDKNEPWVTFSDKIVQSLAKNIIRLKDGV